MSISCFHKPRKSTLRLQHFDYSSPGYYFVTLCTKNRENFFGEIQNEKMILSEIGHMATENWLDLPKYFPDVQLDEYIVMPNHIHGIIVKLPLIREEINTQRWHNGKSRKPSELGTIIGLYKSRCTRLINKMQDKIFFGWQPKYYDHVIENEASLYRVREYIQLNPLKWALDKNNPKNWIDEK